jgi:NAD-dependent dihydropyrimidine dehydrogenase PreA subunit
MNHSDESVDVYERLADAVGALPSGYTRTASKIEIELIKIVFSYEEASLAGQLTRNPETAAEIAQRVGLDEEKVTVLLESMIPPRKVRADTLALESGVKGLGKVEAKAETKAGEKPQAPPVKKYRLSPFLVGWFESYLQERKPDTERFAKLYQQYVIEGGGERIFAPRPGPQGVIPYRGSLKPEWLKREPHNDVDAHFQRHDRFLVIDCVCKKDQVAAHGHSCHMPIKRCGFVGMPPMVPLSENVIPRDEAIKLWDELDAMGTMIVEGFYGYTMGSETPQFVGGCHCCGCCCCILNAGRLADMPETVQRSNYRVVKDYDKCHACGECVRRCQVFAHTFDKATDQKPVYHRDLCVGCGSCGQGCPTGALHLEPVSEAEWHHVASSFTEWEEQRLRNLAAEKERGGPAAAVRN